MEQNKTSFVYPSYFHKDDCVISHKEWLQTGITPAILDALEHLNLEVRVLRSANRQS